METIEAVDTKEPSTTTKEVDPLNIGLGDLNDQIKAFHTWKSTGQDILVGLKKSSNSPDYEKPKRLYSITEVMQIIDVSRQTIRRHESIGSVQYELPTEGQKSQYSISDINQLRKALNKGFWNDSCNRPENCKPLVLGVAMFKGGVGKTTTSTHLAAKCAISGLKTLLVDLDPQASATLAFNFVPSVDIDEENDNTLRMFFEEPEYIKNLIIETHFDNLDIIPSSLSLSDANVSLYLDEQSIDTLGSPLLRLSRAIEAIKNDYDVIILDCPPNHEPVCLNALYAADGLLLPINPEMLSFGSSVSFLRMLYEVNEQRNRILKGELELSNFDMEFIHSSQLEVNRFFRILITNDPINQESIDAVGAIRTMFGQFVLSNTMAHSICLERASNKLSILYDHNRKTIRGDKNAFTRATNYMDRVNEEIINLMKRMWGA